MNRSENLKKRLFEKVTVDDILNLDDPQVLYILIQISEQLALTDSVISSAIYRAARYPIVDFNISIANTDNLSTDELENYKQKIESLIDDKYRLKETLINLLVDYYTYGIGILTLEVNGEKVLKCTNCKMEYPTSLFKNYPIKNHINIKPRNNSNNDEGDISIMFNIECRNCGNKELEYFDKLDPYYIYISNSKVPVYHSENPLQLRLLSIKNLEVYYNNFINEMKIVIKGEKTKEIVNEIIENFNIPSLDKINYAFLKYALMGKDLLLDNSKLFVLRYVLPSGVSLPFYPPLARGYRVALLLLELYRALIVSSQEVIPIRFLYTPPSSQIGVTPVYNTTKKAEVLQQVVKEAEQNPLRLSLIDQPYEKIEIGGSLNSIPYIIQLIEMLYAQIIGITEMPKELIMEGTWASNIISIRLLENSLKNIMHEINDFLSRFANILQNIYNLPQFKLSLVPFRRMDSLSEFQLLLQIMGEKFPKELILKTYYGLTLKELYDQIEYEQELEEKYSILSQFEHELRMMKYKNYIEQIVGGKQDESGNIPQEKLEEIADEIIEQSKGNEKKIVEYLKALASQYGEEAASEVLEIIKQKLSENKEKGNKKDTDSKPLPEKKPTRRDDIKSDVKNK